MTREELEGILPELHKLQRECFANNSIGVEIMAQYDTVPFVRVTVYNKDAVVKSVSPTGTSVDYEFIHEWFYLFTNKEKVSGKFDRIKRFINHKGEWKEQLNNN